MRQSIIYLEQNILRVLLFLMENSGVISPSRVVHVLIVVVRFFGPVFALLGVLATHAGEDETLAKLRTHWLQLRTTSSW